ncbi:MAG: twin-arginine translocase TatA/TatE family subunit [Synergistaceae bacterium]|nr:twin-arginine translocase TatA/TatE family subunit [Synergistaceae bacterium]
MFNVGLSELFVIFLIAFLVVGAEDLPKVARWLGRQIKGLRLLIKEIKSEVGWNDLVNDTQGSINHEIKSLKSEFDVSSELNHVSETVENTMREIKKL